MKTKPTFKQERLCCKVKQLGLCERCEHPVCEEHAVVCSECGMACFECSSADLCTECNVSVCRFCMRVDDIKSLKCSTCFNTIESDAIDPDEFGGSDYDIPDRDTF